MEIDVIGQVKAIAAPYLAEHDIELVDIIYRREHLGMVVRLVVDTPGGISLDDCAKLNTFLSQELDKANIIDERYVVEVSSPGLDRNLVTDRDFERVLGEELDITTFAITDGRRTHSGKLVGIEKETIVLELSGVSTVIQRAGIAKATLKLIF